MCTQCVNVQCGFLSGFTVDPMWIGLRMWGTSSGTCNSPADCSNKFVYHHEHGWDDDWRDDVWFKFIHEGFVDVGMNLDRDDGSCVVMEAADYTNENQLQSRSCNNTDKFVCTVS